MQRLAEEGQSSQDYERSLAMFHWREIESNAGCPAGETIRWTDLAAVPTFYEDLGVTGEATQEEIRRAYRQLALSYHPDTNREIAVTTAEDRMKRLNRAYDALRVPERREAYDKSLDL